MPNMKTEMNNILLTQAIERRKHMQYYEKTVKLIVRVIEDSRNNKTKKTKLCTQIFSE